MMIFSSLEKAVEHGFQWLEFRPDLGVHVVERSFSRGDGKLVRALAFAKPTQSPAIPQASAF
jgi:hypothetical protein